MTKAIHPTVDHYPTRLDYHPERPDAGPAVGTLYDSADQTEGYTARLLGELTAYQAIAIAPDETPGDVIDAENSPPPEGARIPTTVPQGPEDLALTDDAGSHDTTTAGRGAKGELPGAGARVTIRREGAATTLGPTAISTAAHVSDMPKVEQAVPTARPGVEPAEKRQGGTGTAVELEEGDDSSQNNDNRPPGGTGPPPGADGERGEDDENEEPHDYILPPNFGPGEAAAPDSPSSAESGETVYAGNDERTIVNVRVTDEAPIGSDPRTGTPLYGRRITASIQLHAADGRLVMSRQTTEDLPYDSDDPEVARRADPQQTPPDNLARDFAKEQLQHMTPTRQPETGAQPRPAFTEIMQLSPRPDARDEVLQTLSNKVVFGIEVTDPVLARACAAGNVDPQHLGGRSDLSAIQAITALLSGEAGAATISPDLDSMGSLAVLAIAIDIIAQDGTLEGPVLERIGLIGNADRFEKGEWSGIRPLPTMTDPWSDIGTAAEMHALAAMAFVVRDPKLSLDERVTLIKRWLATGEEPQAYRNQATAERYALIKSLESHKTSITTMESDHYRIATIISPYFSIGLGYHRAPVVVALNPAFRFRGGEPYPKMTIAQFTDHYVDLQAVFAELNVLEAAARGIPLESLKNRWNGSPTIGGSPQGEATVLSAEQVAEVVARHPASPRSQD
jgi:hypothetical protein